MYHNLTKTKTKKLGKENQGRNYLQDSGTVVRIR